MKVVLEIDIRFEQISYHHLKYSVQDRTLSVGYKDFFNRKLNNKELGDSDWLNLNVRGNNLGMKEIHRQSKE
jgi:hypothetical protein